MGWSLKRFFKFLLISALTVGVICSCCSCAVKNTQEPTEYEQEEEVFFKNETYKGDKYVAKELSKICSAEEFPKFTFDVIKGYGNFLDSTFSKSVITKYDFLSALLEKLEIEVEKSEYDYSYIVDYNYFDNSDLFETALDMSVLPQHTIDFDSLGFADREYVANTLVRAVEFTIMYSLDCADKSDVTYDREVASCLYRGYLELDENDCFNPHSPLAQEDFDYIMNELDILKQLKGKKILTFGDSIMHGDGNFYEGVADLLSRKYQAIPIDYSKGGATFGYHSEREQISNQILKAVSECTTADVILIDGGTNDMRMIKPGEISKDKSYGSHGRYDFCSGMEYAFGLLQDNYPKTPVIYFRAHNMEFSLERNELHFGRLALEICKKWEVDVVDIFEDTDFNTHDKTLCSEYTRHSKRYPNGDSVHPNKSGYYEFYLPLLTEKILENIETE